MIDVLTALLRWEITLAVVVVGLVVLYGSYVTDAFALAYPFTF